MDWQVGKIILQHRGAMFEKFAGDIDRHIGSRINGAQQVRRFYRTARTKFNHGPPPSNSSGEVSAMILQQPGLGPRRIIFRQFGDVFKQFRPAPVIKPARRNRVGLLLKAAAHILAEGMVDKAGGHIHDRNPESISLLRAAIR